ncbi:MAG: lysylphosphatidylglycerol synthase domain-containing protein, partial [bacterium]
TFLLDAVAHWWVLGRFNPPMSFRQTVASRGESYLLLSLGFLYGQGGMAYSVSKRTGKPLGEVAGSLLFLMFNNFLVLLLFPTVALAVLINRVLSPGFIESQQFSTLLWWLGVSWPVSILLIVFFARDWDNPLRRRLKKGIHTAFDKATVKDYATALSLRGVQVVNWCVFSWLGLMAFDVGISFSMLLLLGPIIALAAVIPTPGRLGTSQGAWVLMFGYLAHVEPAALFAFSLMWTILVNLLRWLTGMVSLLINRAGEKP